MKLFTDYPIHNEITSRLEAGILNDRLAHAYLFYGREGSGKEALAIEIAKALNCKNTDSRPCNECASCQKIQKLNHPDVKFIFPLAGKFKEDNKEIRKRLDIKSSNPYLRIEQNPNSEILVDHIRQLKNESIYPPYEGQKKVYIIADAERMNRESANSFLKLLEEPPQYLHIILITSNKNLLLDTIKSRCQAMYFKTLSDEQVKEMAARYIQTDRDIDAVVRYAQGNLKLFFETVDSDFKQKQELSLDFLRAIMKNDPLFLSDNIDNMYRGRDKNFLMETLNLLILWFQDALRLSSGDRNAGAGSTYSSEVENFVKYYPGTDCGAVINLLEEARQQITGNMYVPIVMSVLALKIERNLKKSKN